MLGKLVQVENAVAPSSVILLLRKSKISNFFKFCAPARNLTPSSPKLFSESPSEVRQVKLFDSAINFAPSGPI